MTDREQLEAFANDIGNLVYRYRDEFDLTVAAMVGVLECAKHDIMECAGGDEYEIDIE